ncbi:MAG: hypothetical protein V4683_13725 [Bacteroidota bacterium]
MNKNLLFKYFLITLLVLLQKNSIAQIGVNADGSAPSTNAMLDVKSSNKGIMLPRIADPASILSPTDGLLFYNTTAKKFNYYDGIAWQQALFGNQWNVNGSSISYLGGNVGIGTVNSDASFVKFDVKSDNVRFYIPNWPSSITYNTIIGSNLVGKNSLGPQARFSNEATSTSYDIGMNGTEGFTIEQNDSPRLIVSKAGNVGIGISSPTATLDVARGLENTGTALFRGTNFHSFFNADVSENTYIRGGKPTSDVILADVGSGKVGIGTVFPGFPLSFTNALGDKIALWGSSGNHFGFGIQGSLLQIHTDAAGADIAFGHGTSAAMTETMRIKGNGNVGIGTSTFAIGEKFAVKSGTTQFGIFPGMLDNVANANWTTFDMGGTAGLRIWDKLSVSGFIGTGIDPAYHLDVNGDTRLTNTENSNGGNVGIGIIPVSNAKLHIKSNQQFGVFIDAPTTVGGQALYVSGTTAISGNLSKGGGSFKIDHPLDPENKYLYHSFVESPDMMNVYNGNIQTDGSGLATVILPDYFEALNKDFRYQLTVIGTFAQAIIMEEVKGNQFVIKTDKPNIKVSWQVTGIRQDAYANKNRIPVSENKKMIEKGTYLHPDAFGVSDSKNVMKIQMKLAEH